MSPVSLSAKRAKMVAICSAVTFAAGLNLTASVMHAPIFLIGAILIWVSHLCYLREYQIDTLSILQAGVIPSVVKAIVAILFKSDFSWLVAPAVMVAAFLVARLLSGRKPLVGYEDILFLAANSLFFGPTLSFWH